MLSGLERLGKQGMEIHLAVVLTLYQMTQLDVMWLAARKEDNYYIAWTYRAGRIQILRRSKPQRLLSRAAI